jgi:DNA-binding Lrp family transcriptional regulator
MVITQREFHAAMKEINVSFAALVERVEKLEKELAKRSGNTPAKKTVDKAA